MRRRYNTELFKNLIIKLNEKIKDVCIGVDVIVGFPGETKEYFENTYNFLDSLPISYLHVFKYSERRNTAAVMLPGSVDVHERNLRSEILRNLSAKKKFEYYSRFTGETKEVLLETRKNGYVEGWTKNYLRVKVNYTEGIEHQLKQVLLKNTNGIKAMEGELV
jgi:threonylcarbamoyladenosine tRNA methylthiotransferase MtaB